ncbi:MAG: cellulase family glycosylhydrolase [Lachnospiraceae bacterium]|nr:cellulase family glycosylhydrolase [Lachnospiraceae bacterium]
MNKGKISIVIIVVLVVLALGVGFFAGRLSKKGGNAGDNNVSSIGSDENVRKSEATGMPEITEKTEGTSEPVEPTQEADTNGASEPTKQVESTGTSEPTKQAESTETSEPTKQVESTETSETTKQAEGTETPEPTKQAETTETPEPTKKPEPTAAPTPTATVTKTEKGTPYEDHGRLAVKGTKLVDKNGDEYRLRGVSTHGIAWFPDYVNKASFQTLRDDWGVNCIRLAMYTAEYNGYCSGGNKTELRKLVNNGVKYATELGMYVIVDWHILSDSNPMTNKDEAVKFFNEMSEKYAEYGNVIFEICNEPNGGTSWSQIKKYAEEVIPVIRKNAPKAIIVVGTPTWSQEVDKAAADPIKDYDNIMYTIHFYAATHKDDLRKRMQAAVRSGIALFCTEFGTCDASGNGGNDFNEAQKWIDAMESSGVSYCIWNLSNKSETSALISSGCSKISGWKESDLSASGKWYAKLLRSKAAEGTISSGIGDGIKDTDTGNDSTDKNSGAGEDKNSGDNRDSQDKNSEKNNGGNDPENDDSQKGSHDTPLEPVTVNKGNITVVLSHTGGWNDGKKDYYQFTINIRNDGNSALENWKITLEFAGKYELSQSWNGNFESKNKKLTVSPVDFNSTISAGGSAEIGFIICGDEVEKMPGITF